MICPPRAYIRLMATQRSIRCRQRGETASSTEVRRGTARGVRREGPYSQLRLSVCNRLRAQRLIGQPPCAPELTTTQRVGDNRAAAGSTEGVRCGACCYLIPNATFGVLRKVVIDEPATITVAITISTRRRQSATDTATAQPCSAQCHDLLLPCAQETPIQANRRVGSRRQDSRTGSREGSTRTAADTATSELTVYEQTANGCKGLHYGGSHTTRQSAN
jgi:hypothetical protein